MTKEKLYQWIVPILLLIVLVGLIIYEQSKDKYVGATSKFGTARDFINSTTTPRFDLGGYTNMVLLTSATTTYTFSIDGADSVDLNFAYAATSSTGIPTLAWNYEFCESDTEGVCYREDITSTSGNTVTHNADGLDAASSTITHVWTPRTASSTVFKNVRVTPSGVLLGSKFMKLNLSCWVGSCRWGGEAILKKAF